MDDLRIGFAYNEKPAEDAEAEPPSGEPPHTRSHDRYAEWDDPATIAAVESALRCSGEVIRLEADGDFPEKLRAARPDIVFNIAEGLYGPNREAHVPAICEFYDIPYTGSDPLSLCLALDKRRAKEAFVSRGVLTPRCITIEPPPSESSPRRRVAASPRPRMGEWADGGSTDSNGLESLRYPVVVKPLFEGSSKGIPDSAFCRSIDAAQKRLAEIHEEYAQPAIIEEFLPGREFTVAILGNGAEARALPPVEILFDSLPAGAAPLYSYEAKWLWDIPAAPLKIFECPADVDARLGDAIARAALDAFEALGCRDWSRVDVRLDAQGHVHVLEINPLPGILPQPEQNSCYPKAARAAGISYDELMCAVLDCALVRSGLARVHA
jgi:D-alanine-D-alanine ligase